MKTQIFRLSALLVGGLLLTASANAQYNYYGQGQPVVQTYAPQQSYPQGYYGQPQQYAQPYSHPQQYNQSQQSAPASPQPAYTQTVNRSPAPSYQQPIGGTGKSSYDNQGNRYDSWAGAGLDERGEVVVGGSYHGSDEKFLGVQASKGAGLYGEAGISQSGQIGNVDVRNYAQGTTFVGVEGGAQAGLNQDGLAIGANGFAGGRVAGTVGSDIGALGYGANGEAWSGLGAEAGVNAGYDDGVLTVGGELGAALGVGGKVGLEASIDVGAVAEDIHGVTQDVGQWGQRAGQDIGNWTQQRGRDVGKAANNVGKGVGNTAKNVGQGVNKAAKGVGNTAKNVGQGVNKAAKGVGKGVNKAAKGLGKLFGK